MFSPQQQHLEVSKKKTPSIKQRQHRNHLDQEMLSLMQLSKAAAGPSDSDSESEEDGLFARPLPIRNAASLRLPADSDSVVIYSPRPVSVLPACSSHLALTSQQSDVPMSDGVG